MVIYNLTQAICMECGISPENCPCWRELNDAEIDLFMEGHISPPSAEVIEDKRGRVFIQRITHPIPARYSYPL